MIRTLTDELHIHLYGCLTAEDIYTLGKDRYHQVPERLSWYEAEYEKAYGRRPNAAAYWTKDSGFEQLRADFEFVGAGPFAEFQACFNLMIALLPVVPGDTVVLKHVLSSQRAAGVRFGEYRCFVPPHLTDADIARYVEAAASAALAVESDSGGSFTPRLAFSIARSPEKALAQHAVIAGLLSAKPELARAVTGLDFCGVEEGHPPRTMRDVFSRIRAVNAAAPHAALAILYHVGESFSDMTLVSAARWVWQAHALGAHRLGHAVALGLAPESLVGQPLARERAGERRDHLAFLLTEKERLAQRGYAVDIRSVTRELDALSALPDHAELTFPQDEAALADARRFQDALLEDLTLRGAVVESCPTSNFRIGRIASAPHHPLPRFLQAGLATVVSTDDPGTFCISLGDEEDLCRTLFGLGTPAMAALKATGERCRSERLAGRVIP